MRVSSANESFSVQAVAGTYVVLLGLDATPDAATGLLGFSIYRQIGNAGRRVPLGGGKLFQGVHDESERDKVRSDRAPLQTFMWSDYTAEPNQTYTYHVVPVYGQPNRLEPNRKLALKVTVTTEDVEGETHAVYFNRGVAGSQAYARLFGEHRRWYLAEHQGRIRPQSFIKPGDVPNHEAYRWLSRGLEEAMIGFIRQAQDADYSIRAAVYELTHVPAIQAFVDALERGVDVKVVHHAKRKRTMELKSNKETDTKVERHDGTGTPKVHKNHDVVSAERKDEVCLAAEKAIGAVGVKDPNMLRPFSEMFIERTNTQISHNKFVVLLKNGKPISVWTGSTNFTAGGIFGQTNVGHIVRDGKVARKYLDYWKQLAKDPAKGEMQAWTAKHTPDPKNEPASHSITPVFSPRPKTKSTVLDWYAEQAGAAQNAVFFTAAFSVDERFLEQFAKDVDADDDQPFQRYILLESRSGKMREKYQRLAKNNQNRIAWGDTMKPRDNVEDESQQFIETLTGLNDHVEYLHTKFMLVDPLSDDPLVVTGSANFSENSTVANDENMLIIRGDTRLADIFLGEFMRIFNHFRSRNESNALSDKEFERRHHLAPDDSWTRPYYREGSQEQQERLLFRSRE